MEPPFTLPFETFWSWVVLHPNCILRAGTPEAVLYDTDALHWYLGPESEDTLVVQLIHGKRPIGELFIEHKQVAYVQAVPSQREDEHVFELVSAGDTEPFAAWFFVMTHGYEEEGTPEGGKVH